MTWDLMRSGCVWGSEAGFEVDDTGDDGEFLRPSVTAVAKTISHDAECLDFGKGMLDQNAITAQACVVMFFVF